MFRIYVMMVDGNLKKVKWIFLYEEVFSVFFNGNYYFQLWTLSIILNASLKGARSAIYRALAFCEASYKFVIPKSEKNRLI